MTFHILVAFTLYFAVLLGIALIFYKKAQSASGYSGGHQSMNYWVTAIAAQSSDMSSWLFMALPGIFYLRGMFEIWTIVGLVLFSYLNWQFIAPKLRTINGKEKSLTLGGFFEKRFGDKSGTIRIITSFVSLFFFVLYLASGFVAMGRIFEPCFGISYHSGMVLGLIVTVSYILIGGLLAVAWCDLFQGLFMLLMIGIVPIAAYNYIDSWTVIENIAAFKNISLSVFPKSKSLLDILFLVGSYGIGYFGQPHILVNFMGTQDVKKLKYSRWIGTTWQVLTLSSGACIGLLGIAIFKTGLANPELIFISMVNKLFTPFSASIIMCAVFAAIVTTLDTQILVTASTFTHDFYAQLSRKKPSDKKLLFVTKLATVIFSLIGLGAAYNNNATIYDIVMYSWAGLGSSFGPLVIAALYSKKTNVSGAIAGIISGALIAGLWPLLNSPIPQLIPGFLGSSLCIYIFSKIDI